MLQLRSDFAQMELDENLRNWIIKQVDQRWERMHNDVTSIAYYLDPTFNGASMVGNEYSLTKNEIKRMLIAEGISCEAIEISFLEFSAFCSSLSTDMKSAIRKVTPKVFWKGEGKNSFPFLAGLAKKVFSIPTSSASAERNFSASIKNT